MGITVAVQEELLALPKNSVGIAESEHFGRVLLVPNVEYQATIRSTVKAFLEKHLFIPADLQVLVAPLFTKLSEKDSIESIYKRYACQPETEAPDVHLDEDNFVFYGREGGRTVEVDDSRRLEEYHILDKSLLHLSRLPKPLAEKGGRIFVETKDGILPLLGIFNSTPVAVLKHFLEKMTGIPVQHQLLSSVGRDMHDDLYVRDFDGPHRICEDSTLDLCKSGDSNSEQSHRRMAVTVDVMGEQSFTLVVQARDLVQSVLQVVQSRTGIVAWQQRITFSGKVLQEKKSLGDYYIHPNCTLQVTVFRSPLKPPLVKVADTTQSRENAGAIEEQKPAARKIKLMRTSKGHSKGMITIPVLTTDTISDLKRKVRRTLQPLTERNFVLLHSPAAKDICFVNRMETPSPHKTPTKQSSESGSRVSRVLSFTKSFSSPTASPAGQKPEFPPPPHILNLYPLPPSPVERPAECVSKLSKVLSLTGKTLSGSILSPSKPPQSPAMTRMAKNLFPASSSSGPSPIPAALTEAQRSKISQGLSGEEGSLSTVTNSGNGHRRNASSLSSSNFSSISSTTPHQSDESSIDTDIFSQLSEPQNLPPNMPGRVNLNESEESKKTDDQDQAPASCEKKKISFWLTDSMQSLKEHIRAPFVER